MSMSDSPTRRRPVPPPKTESQTRLRQELTSPITTSQTEVPNQHEPVDRPRTELLDTESKRREAMKHLTLPPGWDMRNSVDVTYHTHIAKPIVHETIIQHTTEIVEPRITRETHEYHEYGYIQPLEVEVPDASYATNAKGEVIHAPGGLNNTRTGETTYWEQDRQDRGYGFAESLRESTDGGKTDPTLGRDSVAGPFPIQAEGGGERILQHVRDGGIAKRFGGTLTSPESSTSHADNTNAAAEPQTRFRGAGFEETSQYRGNHSSHMARTPPPKEILNSTNHDSSAPGHIRSPNPNATS